MGSKIRRVDSCRGGYILKVDASIILFLDKDILPVQQKKIDKEQNTGLIDYKLFCFNGNPRMTLVCSERFSGGGLKEDFFSETWEHLDIQRPGHRCSDQIIPYPKQYNLMKKIASELSKDIPFARIDFYTINSHVYFGEITFYPASGFVGFIPETVDVLLGKKIMLQKQKDKMYVK